MTQCGTVITQLIRWDLNSTNSKDKEDGSNERNWKIIANQEIRKNTNSEL